MIIIAMRHLSADWSNIVSNTHVVFVSTDYHSHKICLFIDIGKCDREK